MESIKENSPKSYCVLTYGCQMNVYDSEIICALLEQMGYLPVEDPEHAEVVVFNTCCIRDNADQKVYGRLGDFKGYKQRKPEQILVVAGCLAQKDRQELAARFPQIDIVLGTHEVKNLPTYIKQAAQKHGQQVMTATKGDHLQLEASPRSSFMAMVPISVGCNQWCTYCIVPHVRGPLHSRPLPQIYGEVKRLVESGYKDITLLGQNVNDYGRDLKPKSNFAELLAHLGSELGQFRLRFTSPHPAYYSQETIQAMAANPNVCQHIHLPLQSGDDEILKVMHRGYTGQEFIDLAKRMREAIPDLSITTDIIVGFADETEAQFEHTLDVVRAVEFDSAFMFAYSERPGTPGCTFPNRVPEEERMRRLYRLIEVQNEISQRRHTQRLGRVVEVLVEGPSKKERQRYTGRTRNHWLVHFDSAEDLSGQLVSVRLERAFMWGFIGTLVGE